MDATVIGDVVNTASRLESLTREKDYKILISEATYESLLHRELFSLHDLGKITPRGKVEMVQIYGVDTFERRELPETGKIREI